ncbi:MAG: hypothetical protein MI807_03665, partial [Verrucomicrobiales bacterium]|nr:hypothetical protein [Verrucomicrobiales bacterium]
VALPGEAAYLRTFGVKKRLQLALSQLKGRRNIFIARMMPDRSWRLDVNIEGRITRGISLESLSINAFVSDLMQEAGFDCSDLEDGMPSKDIFLNDGNELHRIWVVRSPGLQPGTILRGIFCDGGTETGTEQGADRKPDHVSS